MRRSYPRRKSADERGYGSQWRKTRKLYMDTHPLCEDCLEQGLTTPAQEVHHIVKKRLLPAELADKEENLMALCCACHDVRTARGE